MKKPTPARILAQLKNPTEDPQGEILSIMHGVLAKELKILTRSEGTLNLERAFAIATSASYLDHILDVNDSNLEALWAKFQKMAIRESACAISNRDSSLRCKDE